jgi:hypothetical protein
MKLLAQKTGKNDKFDKLRYLRGDGTSSEITMPRQGILPHDLIHYVVESKLRLSQGFTGLVARGAEPDFMLTQTHDQTNLQIGTETIQVEAIVAALQTQLWSGAFDFTDFEEGIRTACAARNTPEYRFADIADAQALYRNAIELFATWQGVPHHRSLELEFVA